MAYCSPKTYICHSNKTGTPLWSLHCRCPAKIFNLHKLTLLHLELMLDFNGVTGFLQDTYNVWDQTLFYSLQCVCDPRLIYPLFFVALRWTNWRRQKAKGKLRRRWRSLSRWCLVGLQAALHPEGTDSVVPLNWRKLPPAVKTAGCELQYLSVCVC